MRLLPALLVVMFTCLFWSKGHTKDLTGKYTNSPYKKWFESQQNADGGSCCAESDGYAYYGDYQLNDDGSATLQLEAGPHHIPATKVLKGQNPTGTPVWWHIGATTYCFSPGSLT